MRIVSGTSPDSVVNGVYCGSTLPMPITSEANTLRIEFNSDNSVQKTGFNARFFTGTLSYTFSVLSYMIVHHSLFS